MHLSWHILAAGLIAVLVGGVGRLWPAADASIAWARATTTTQTIDLAPWRTDRSALLDPRARLPHTHTLPIAGLRAVLAGEHDGGDHPGLRKLASWQARNSDDSLPDSFFEQPPFMHPMGESYAALAGHPRLRHVSEAPPDGPLGTTTDATRRALVDGHTRIVGERWVLLPETRTSVRAIPRREFDARLAAAGLQWRACAAVSARCLLPRARPWTGGLLAIGAVLTALGGGALGVQQQRERRHRRRDQVFALRTLTHELRTPATAVGLELDRLRRHFDHLPPEGQDALLGLSSANQRLRGTLEATGTFLSVTRGEVDLQTESVPLAAHIAQLTAVPIHGEATVRTDPRWLTVALGNLLANAAHHGTAPVRVEIAGTASGALVSVVDSGNLDAELHSLCRPFERGPDSAGLGLGLALTHRVARLLGGELSLSCQPTRFTLRLENRQ